MRRARVLFVDDEPQIRRMMRMILGACGFEVTDTWSGGYVLEKFRCRKYDLVLMDTNMVCALGVEMCKAMRAESDVPVMVLTAFRTEHDMLEALEAGADDYVTKPFCTPELLSRIDQMLRRRDRSYDFHPTHLRLKNIAADFEVQKATGRWSVANSRLAVTH
jgi:DNA-binding response OmpR family regulator